MLHYLTYIRDLQYRSDIPPNIYWRESQGHTQLSVPLSTLSVLHENNQRESFALSSIKREVTY